MKISAKLILLISLAFLGCLAVGGVALGRKYQNSKAQELMVALTEQGDRITTLLDQATAQNHQQVQTSSQRAGAAYDNALSQLILSIVVVLVGLMLVGGWLFWQIRHGIRSAVHLMQEAVNKVEAGVSSAGEASQKMNDICSVAGDSEALVQDISHAIREQGQATDVIAQQVETVAQQANENSSSAASCQKLANELTSIAHSMDDVLRSYHL